MVKTQEFRRLILMAAVIMMVAIAGCKDSDNSGDNSDGNEIDSKLVGNWNRTDIAGQGTNWKYYHFFFNNDKTFHYFLVSIAEYSYKGNFSVSDGKIYFSNVVFTNDDYKADKPDSYVDYVIEHDDYGDQLKLSNTGDSWTGSTWWRRDSSQQEQH